jgi:hypothetical protein
MLWMQVDQEACSKGGFCCLDSTCPQSPWDRQESKVGEGGTGPSSWLELCGKFKARPGGIHRPIIPALGR